MKSCDRKADLPQPSPRVQSPRVQSPRVQGFTLLEVLVAILMVGMVMTATYSVLFTTMSARDLIEKNNLESKIGPSILNLIERDVMGVWSWNIHKNDVFLGEMRVVSGERADFFHFITCTNSSFTITEGDQQSRSDLTEVSYMLRQNPRNPDLLELFRRQDYHVDDKIAEGGLFELIYARIRSFQITYYADLYESAEKLHEWDATKRGRLPAAMEIDLVLEIDPTLAGYTLDEMVRERLYYHRVLFPPRSSELTMGVRPVIPTFVDPEEAGENPQGGGGSGGEGGMGEGGGPEGSSGRFNGEEGGEGEGGRGPFGGGERPEDPPPFRPPPDMPQAPPDDIDLDELMKLLGG